MALNPKRCLTLDKSVLILYEEDEQTGLSPADARNPAHFSFSQGKTILALDRDKHKDIVTFHENIPGTSILTSGLKLRGGVPTTVSVSDGNFSCTLSTSDEPHEESPGKPQNGEDFGRHLDVLSQAVNTLSFRDAAQHNGHSGTNGYGARNGDNGSAIVSGEIQEVLRWRPRLSDPQGFLGALEQSFERKDVGGTPDYTWKPRSYVVITDLSGEITGAQASLCSRAKLAVDESSRLLDGLEPLNPAFDEENFDANVTIIQQRMSEIVEELGRPAGPRVAKLDTLFEQLLGDKDFKTADEVKGRLGTLRDDFGFDTGHVNTIEEEQNATNFRIMVDHLISLRSNWTDNSAYFNGQKRFLGTQMVLLERLLATVAEGAEEVRGALDAVLLGLHEQRSLVVRFKNKRPPSMLVDDLLDWVHDFGAEDGPRLAREGGRTAIASELLNSAQQLSTLVKDAADPEVQCDDENERTLPEEYFYPIVQTALKQLQRHLNTLVQEAKLSAPKKSGEK